MCWTGRLAMIRSAESRSSVIMLFEIPAKRFQHLERVQHVLARDAEEMLQRPFELSSRDLPSSFEIDHLTVFLEEIELTFPIFPDYENIDTVRLHVVDLLLPGHFRDHEIHVSDRLEDRNALLERDQGLLALELVELVRRDGDDHAARHLLHSAEEIEV